jgi:hypothetical protein
MDPSRELGKIQDDYEKKHGPPITRKYEGTILSIFGFAIDKIAARGSITAVRTIMKGVVQTIRKMKDKRDKKKKGGDDHPRQKEKGKKKGYTS